MPELPEVETIKRDLEAKILSTTIEDIEIRDSRVLHSISPKKFKALLKGRAFQARPPQRQGSDF